MSRKRFLLFLIVCLIAGATTVAGSMIGQFMGHTGLHIGAVLGGIAGIVVAVKIAVKRDLLAPKRLTGAIIGGVLGFALAVAVAVTHLHTPVIPILSVALIGLGAVMGAGARHGKRPDR